MYKLTLISCLIIYSGAIAQPLKELNPKPGKLLDKSPQGEIAWRKTRQDCELFFEKTADRGGYEKLSAAEQKKYDQCSEDEMRGYWDAVGDGCSWYCGGGPDSVYASSKLKSQSGIQYDAANAHDLSYKSAWVEGAPGNGIGQYLVYRFSPTAPRITRIIIANGYIKSEKSWKENARVKKLKMYINQKPFAILNLQDNRYEQVFEVDPIGNENRDDWELLEKQPAWTMKFEIMEVYKGDRFEDCAISELFFDGIDVHCLGAGTAITMADGSNQLIEQIRKGDWVMSYDIQSGKMVPARVTSLISKTHRSLVKLVFTDREILTTTDHPFFTASGEWMSVNPSRSNIYYLQSEKVNALKAGEKIFVPGTKRHATLLGIRKIAGPLPTYTLELEKGDSFIANGMLVKTEIAR